MKNRVLVIFHSILRIYRNSTVKKSINLVFISVFFIYIFFTLFNNYYEISEYMVNIDKISLLYLILIVFINYLLLGFSWNLIVFELSESIDFKTNFINYAYSQLANIIPTPIPFLSSRFYLYKKNNLPKLKVLNLTIKELTYHFFSGAFIFIIAKIIVSGQIYWILGLPLSLLVISYTVGFNPKLIISRNNIHQIKYNVGIFFINLITWISSGLFFYYVFQLFRITIPFNPIELYSIWISSNLISYIGAYTLGLSGLFREFTLNILLSKYFDPSISILIPFAAKFLILLGTIISSIIILLFRLIGLKKYE